MVVINFCLRAFSQSSELLLLYACLLVFGVLFGCLLIGLMQGILAALKEDGSFPYFQQDWCTEGEKYKICWYLLMRDLWFTVTGFLVSTMFVFLVLADVNLNQKHCSPKCLLFMFFSGCKAQSWRNLM
jgi:hypothetical protein